ncbi:hypothetical protein ABZW30_12515 [Kitasatospora sp. NPDC004669]|uniref:hypothetical protein n=1 Tax=Kitasatospora sp. NPDC004669 TaxID=3154555 RepID=UPI0033A5D7D9
MLDFPAGARLARELAEIPQLAIYAQLSAQPGAGQQGARVSGATRTPPAPLRIHIASYLGPASPGDVHDPYGDQDGITPLVGTLASWARIHIEESNLGAPRSASIGALTAYLSRRDVLAWSIQQMWAGEYASEIHDAWRVLDGLAATRPRRRALQLPCPRCGLLSLSQVDGEDAECGNESCRAVLRPDDVARRVEQYLAIHSAA